MDGGPVSPDAHRGDPASLLDVELMLTTAATCPLTGKDESAEEHTFQVLDNEEEFSAVLDTIPGTASCELPFSIEGEAWHPEVDFEQYEVVWVYLGFYSFGYSGVLDVVGRDLGDTTEIEVILEAPPCGGITSISYPFAFIKVPRRPEATRYLFTETYGPRPDCSSRYEQ